MESTNKLSILIILTILTIINGCLITNCPRGGKRGGNNRFAPSRDTPIKQCVSCGPGHTGQCFGPQICCGPFGCLLNTIDTIHCQKDGNFHQNEPCIAGFMNCHRFNGRCASDGICCNQDSCHIDRSCVMTTIDNEKTRNYQEPSTDFYNFINYQNELNNE